MFCSVDKNTYEKHRGPTLAAEEHVQIFEKYDRQLSFLKGLLERINSSSTVINVVLFSLRLNICLCPPLQQYYSNNLGCIYPNIDINKNQCGASAIKFGLQTSKPGHEGLIIAFTCLLQEVEKIPDFKKNSLQFDWKNNNINKCMK